MLNLLQRKKQKEPQAQKQYAPAESLDGVPVFNNNVTFEKTTENAAGYKVVVVNPKARTKGLRRFGPSVPRHDFELDELGTFVLQHVDGKRTARQIIDAFRQHYNINRREAELSVVQFFKMLIRKGIISIVIK